MDIQNFILPMLMGSPAIKQKIQSITGQPMQHVAKCVGLFMDQLTGGPGLQDKNKVMQEKFLQVYNAGLRMGFTDWQAQLCAADCAGYRLIDVATSFSQRRGWQCTTEELQQLHKVLMPRFLKKGKEVGLFKQQEGNVSEKGIPELGKPKSKGGVPPWRAQKPDMDKSPDHQG